MLSFAPTPIFSGTWDHRPVVSSPLSSSPIRASSPTSPFEKTASSQRQIQSSPIQPPKFKFASRPARPNPVVRKREDAQAARRNLFLQNVRQKADDKKWQRRDIEGQFLKNSWLQDQGQLSQGAPEISDADIEDAISFSQQPSNSEPQQQDEMMLDGIMEEDEELEAMFASYEEQQHQQQPPVSRPPSPSMSDEEYDDIFAELMSQEQPQHNGHHAFSDQMDMTDDHDML